MLGRNILEQFEGYFDLKDCIIEKYDENDWPIRPDILKELTVDKTSLIKQADVVMLMYLLENEFSAEEIKENYHYYEKRTLHGSSLSPAIYSIVGLRTGDKGKVGVTVWMGFSGCLSFGDKPSPLHFDFSGCL